MKWCVTTTKMLIQFSKEIRTLWDKNHRVWENVCPKEDTHAFSCKDGAIEDAKSEEEIKTDIMTYVLQLKFTSKSTSFMTESKVGLLTCASFLQ